MFLCLGGMFAWFVRRQLHPFGTKDMLRLKRGHKYFGYLLFFTVQLAICSGILAKVGNLDQAAKSHHGFWLVLLNIGFVVCVMLVSEIRHQHFINEDYEIHVNKSTPSYTSKDFNE